MKKYIYALILFACSTIVIAQRVSEPLVPLTSSKEIKDAVTKKLCSIIFYPRISCSFGCCPSSNVGKEDNTQPSNTATGLEGHNFIEDPAIIYPNPVKDIMNIKSTDPITVIEILNIHGEVEQTMDPRQEQLDVSNLPAGIYYVRISFENRKTVQVEKIVVVK